MKGPALHSFLSAIAAAALLAGVPADAQTPATAPAAAPAGPVTFEVATIKPNKSGERNRSVRRQPGGRMTVTNMPLRDLIGFAYQVNNLTLVGAPDWTRDESFDMVAKMEGDPPMVPPGQGPDQIQLALRSLLEERFKLKVHRETREMDVYALVMAKPGGAPGRGLKASTQDCSPETMRALAGRGGGPTAPPSGGVMCGARMGPAGHLVVGGMPVSVLPGMLSQMTGRSVLDRTNLSGVWDFELNFAPDPNTFQGPPGVTLPAADPALPSIFTALQEELGLKLDATKAPIEVLVVDHIEPLVPE